MTEIKLRTFSSRSQAPEDAVADMLVLKKGRSHSAWIAQSQVVDEVSEYEANLEAFDQGADLMPRTAVMVEARVAPNATLVAVRTHPLEVENRLAKLLRGEEFVGRVKRQYLYTPVTSKYLLPFVIKADEAPLAALPIVQNGQAWEVLTTNDLISKGDTRTANWFRQINRALNAAGSSPLEERIDVRRKLTRQFYPAYQYVVAYGMGGSTPCAGVLKTDSLPFPCVVDQTCYAHGTNDDIEAHYLAGVINSKMLENAISIFQSRGSFGRRHVHSLAARYTPPFSGTDLQRQIASLAEQIQADALQKYHVSDIVLDYGKALHTRRGQAWSLLDEKLMADLDALVTGLLLE